MMKTKIAHESVVPTLPKSNSKYNVDAMGLVYISHKEKHKGSCSF